MVVIIDLAGQSHFFIGVAIRLTINEAILIGKKVAVGFFRLFL